MLCSWQFGIFIWGFAKSEILSQGESFYPTCCLACQGRHIIAHDKLGVAEPLYASKTYVVGGGDAPPHSIGRKEQTDGRSHQQCYNDDGSLMVYAIAAITLTVGSPFQLLVLELQCLEPIVPPIMKHLSSINQVQLMPTSLSRPLHAMIENKHFKIKNFVQQYSPLKLSLF